MNIRFLKIIIAIYLTSAFALTVLLPLSGILLIVKLTGVGLTWLQACIPLLIAIGLTAPIAACKIILGLAESGDKK